MKKERPVGFVSQRLYSISLILILFLVVWVSNLTTSKKYLIINSKRETENLNIRIDDLEKSLEVKSLIIDSLKYVLVTQMENIRDIKPYPRFDPVEKSEKDRVLKRDTTQSRINTDSLSVDTKVDSLK